MKFEFIYEPVPIIIIRDIFTKKENNEILSEAINNKNKFKHAVISIGEKPDFRSNKAAYYDEIYINDRSRSKLLNKKYILLETSGQNNIQDIKIRKEQVKTTVNHILKSMEMI